MMAFTDERGLETGFKSRGNTGKGKKVGHSQQIVSNTH